MGLDREDAVSTLLTAAHVNRDRARAQFAAGVHAAGCGSDTAGSVEAAGPWIDGMLAALSDDLDSPPVDGQKGSALAARVIDEVRRQRARGVPLFTVIACARVCSEVLGDELRGVATGAGVPEGDLERALALLDTMVSLASHAWEDLDPDTRVARHRAAAREEADERERYQELVDGLPAAVFVLDARGGVVLANRPAAILCGPQTYGWRRPGTHRPIADLIPDLGTEVEAFLASGVEESAFEKEVVIVVADAPRWIEVRMRRREDAPGGRSGVVMMLSDLTARRRAEQDLLASRRALDRKVREGSDEVLRLSASLLVEADGRTRSELEYRMTASKLEAVFRALPDLFFHVNREGRFIEYLASRSELLSVPPAEFMGRTVVEVLPGPIALQFMNAIERAVTSHELVEIAYAMTLAGTDRYFEARLIAITADDVVAIVRDETAHRQAERVIEESEERYRILVDLAPDGIAVHQDGRLVFVNAAAVRLLGASGPGELIGRPVMDIVHPDSRPTARDRIVQMLSERAAVPIAGERFLRLDGTPFDVEVAAGPTRFNGRPAIQVIVRDVTERKRVEEDFRSIFESAVEGIYQCAPDGRMFSANPALAKMHGYATVQEMCVDPRCNWVRIHGGAETWDTFLARVKSDDVVRGFEYDAPRTDGRIVRLRENARALRDADGCVTRIVGMVEDVTEHRELEQRLRHSQKMEAIGRLAGGIAHDFNNLLTAITGYSALLLDDLDRASPMRPRVEEILNAGRRAAALTGQLLAFSRRQVVQPALLDLNTIVVGMERLLKRLVGEEVRLETSLAEAPGSIQADVGQLEQVVMNLVVNARDALPNGGVIRLSTADLRIPEAGNPDHPDVPPGAWVVLTVRDDGVGMDAETRLHVFEPFFTTKGPGKGTGLGLAVVYGIIRQGGGHVAVASEPGQGSTFRVYLPRQDGRAEPRGEPAETRGPEGGGETILIAEDEDAVRGFAVAVLAERGYRVLEARDGAEALAVAARQDRPVDLLLTDIVMPGMNGRELARRLLERQPSVRIVYTSGYTDGDAAFLGLVETGSFFLQKPFSPEGLSAAVRTQLARRQARGDGA